MTHFLTARLFLKPGAKVSNVEEELKKVEGMKIEECTDTKEAAVGVASLLELPWFKRVFASLRCGTEGQALDCSGFLTLERAPWRERRCA